MIPIALDEVMCWWGRNCRGDADDETACGRYVYWDEVVWLVPPLQQVSPGSLNEKLFYN